MSGPRPENTRPWGAATRQDHTKGLKPVKLWHKEEWVVVGQQLSTSMTLGDWSKSRTCVCIKGPPFQTDQGLSSTFLYISNWIHMLKQSNGRIWLGYKATNGNICLAVRHTPNYKDVADYNTYDLAAATSPAHKMVSDSEPCITTFRNKLYIFTKEKDLGYIGYLTTDGNGTYSQRVDISEAAHCWTFRTPSVLEFNGRLWVAITGASEAKPGSGKNYIMVASTADGKEWKKSEALKVEGWDGAVDGWAISTDKVCLGIKFGTLCVFYTASDNGPKTYYTRINTSGSNSDAPLYTRFIPSWDFAHANATASDPQRFLLFCHTKKDGKWKGSIQLTDSDTDGYWDPPTNLGDKAQAFTNKTPAALVVPGLPGDPKFPWRVWVYCKGNGDDKYVYEHSFSF